MKREKDREKAERNQTIPEVIFLVGGVVGYRYLVEHADMLTAVDFAESILLYVAATR